MPRRAVCQPFAMRRVETILIVLAVAFYVWFLSHFGTRQVLGYVRIVGWGLGFTIALEAISRVMNTLGWRVTIADYPPSLSFGELFAARIAGEAIDYVTPSAQLGGQFVMALMVRRKLPMPVGLATVIVASLAEAIGQIMFVSVAILVSMRMIPAAHRLMWPIIGGLTIAIALAGGFFYVQTKRPFSYLWRVAAKFDFAGATREEIKESADEADSILLEFYARHRVRLILSCLCFFIAWSMGPVEIFILLKLLHQATTVRVALLVEGVGLLIERATFLIPAKLVSQEGGKALILALIGYPAGVGFAIGFLRRIKEMVWVLLGLVSLMLHRLVVEGANSTGHALSARSAKVLEIQKAQGEQTL
ncbi:MAG: lysylphosphatidylglycerol synthase domain-containing protein [Candidatus Binataceae bacterium]